MDDSTVHPVDGEACTFYCHPPYHAVPFLAEPGAGRQDVLENLRPYFAARGWRLVDAKRAHEADVAQWRRTLVYHVLGNSPQAVLDRLAPVDAEPWLLLVEPAV